MMAAITILVPLTRDLEDESTIQQGLLLGSGVLTVIFDLQLSGVRAVFSQKPVMSGHTQQGEEAHIAADRIDVADHLFGLPLVHINFRSHGARWARGIIAVGNFATGVVSLGGLSI